jgi:hypothetical protein
MKQVYLEFFSVISAGLGLFLLSAIQVFAQPLVKDAPIGNLTEGVDISISPGEPLPANGTVSISTQGATDTDMNAFPPEGVTVIISSDTVTVTNQPVDIAAVEEEAGETGEEEAGETGEEEAGETGEEEAGETGEEEAAE